MQVAVEATRGLERRMTVELPEETLASEVDARLKSMAGKVRVPGFRPGKVPMKVLARRFGQQVREEVVGEMVRSSFVDALETEKLRPAGGPVIDPLNAEQGKGLSYTAVFEVYPDIELSAMESLAIARPVAEVTVADLQKMFDVLRRQRRTWERVERPAASGDQVTVDFEATVDGETFEGGTAQDFALELGQGRMLAGFEDGIIGVNAGDERTLELEFPADYHVEHLAGKAVRFEVSVKAVAQPVIPEIDAQFIKSFGVEDGEMESFRAEVRGNMGRELETAIRVKTKERVMAALLEANPIEVPKALIDEEAARLIDARRRELANMGIDVSQFQVGPEAVLDEASRRVKLGLLFNEVVKAARLRPDPMKVRGEVERIASSYEDPAQVINWFYTEPGRLAEIESQVVEESAVEAVLARARVTDEPSSFDALLNPGQTTAA